MARKDYQETLRKNKEYYHALKDADPFRLKGDMSKEDLQHLLKWFDVNG